MTNFAEIIAKDEFEFYGIRAHRGEAVAIGDICENSMVWDDGECTGDELDGVCAMRVAPGDNINAAVDMVKRMYGWGESEIILVAGQYGAWGEDKGEVVIRSAVRLA